MRALAEVCPRGHCESCGKWGKGCREWLEEVGDSLNGGRSSATPSEAHIMVWGSNAHGQPYKLKQPLPVAFTGRFILSTKFGCFRSFQYLETLELLTQSAPSLVVRPVRAYDHYFSEIVPKHLYSQFDNIRGVRIISYRNLLEDFLKNLRVGLQTSVESEPIRARVLPPRKFRTRRENDSQIFQV